MNKFVLISGIFLSVFARQCVSFEPVTFDDSRFEDGPVEKEKGLPALAYKGGDLLQGNWWTGTNGEMGMATKDGAMVITCKNIGPAYTPFGMEFGGVDFTDDLSIRVKARSEGESMPVLALQFDDFEGYQSNAKRPTKRIADSEEYKDYYFDLTKDIWVQSWPEDHDVNGTLISKILFFPNPGGPAFTGKIYIKEIQVIKRSEKGEEEEIKMAVGADSALIDDFSGDAGAWWVSKSETGEFKGSKVADADVYKIEATNVGPKYEAFGRGFPTVNVYNANKLRVRARIDGDVPPELRIDLKDPDGYTTNSRPSTNRIYPTENGEFKDYYFRFKDRFLQTYPDRKDVDGQRIVEFVCFVNAGKPPWTGTLYIDEVEFMFTGEVEVEEKVEEKLEVEEDPDNILVDDFKHPIYSWWNDGTLSTAKNQKAMVVTANGTGPNNEAFGRAFAAIDFTKTPKLKVRMKASNDLKLRIDLKDIDEKTTNKSPVVMSVKASDEYQDYIFDFSGKFNQASPKAAEVNAKEILEAVFMINPGGPAYSGKLFVEDIRAVK